MDKICGGCLNTDLSIFSDSFLHAFLRPVRVDCYGNFVAKCHLFPVTIYSPVDFASAADLLDTLLSVDFVNSQFFVVVLLRQCACNIPVYEVAGELSFHSLPQTLIYETRWKFHAKLLFFAF